jgi:hypothetical protein
MSHRATWRAPVLVRRQKVASLRDRPQPLMRTPQERKEGQNKQFRINWFE